jgi:hypothetical protein
LNDQIALPSALLGIVLIVLTGKSAPTAFTVIGILAMADHPTPVATNTTPIATAALIGGVNKVIGPARSPGIRRFLKAS